VSQIKICSHVLLQAHIRFFATPLTALDLPSMQFGERQMPSVVTKLSRRFTQTVGNVLEHWFADLNSDCPPYIHCKLLSQANCIIASYLLCTRMLYFSYFSKSTRLSTMHQCVMPYLIARWIQEYIITGCSTSK
jgi:hypothetical protein